MGESSPASPADELRDRLRRAGITVHLVQRMPPPSDGASSSLCVFLEGHLNQQARAMRIARTISGVTAVTQSGATKAILIVTGKGDSLR
jgi:hypothetical protein